MIIIFAHLEDQAGLRPASRPEPRGTWGLYTGRKRRHSITHSFAYSFNHWLILSFTHTDTQLTHSRFCHSRIIPVAHSKHDGDSLDSVVLVLQSRR